MGERYMAAINDLIGQIKDPELRAQIEREVSKLAKQKKKRTQLLMLI